MAKFNQRISKLFQRAKDADGDDRDGKADRLRAKARRKEAKRDRVRDKYNAKIEKRKKSGTELQNRCTNYKVITGVGCP